MFILKFKKKPKFVLNYYMNKKNYLVVIFNLIFLIFSPNTLQLPPKKKEKEVKRR